MQRNEVTKVTLQLVAAACLTLLAGSPTRDIAFAQSGALPSAVLNGDPVRGETLYQGCMDCHSIEKNDVGPMHRGVVGRPAGIISGYVYSKALKTSGLTWDDPTLDHWLADPGALVPGTKMFYNVPSAQDHADIIAFLKQQK